MQFITSVGTINRYGSRVPLVGRYINISDLQMCIHYFHNKHISVSNYLALKLGDMLHIVEILF